MLGMGTPNMHLSTTSNLLTDEEEQGIGFPLGKKYVTFVLIFETKKQSSTQVIKKMAN